MKEFILILGPCVIESRTHTNLMAEKLAFIVSNLKKEFNINFYFKASFDKANRSSIKAYRGPGLDEGLKILIEIKNKYLFQLTSDIHEISQINKTKEVLDLFQIPAFLSRQTDLILEAIKTNKSVNIKKGQFLSPIDIQSLVEKTNSKNLIITERGSSFGYNNLVVDMSVFPYIKSLNKNIKIVYDASHSLPNIYKNKRSYIRYLSQSAIASSCIDGLFIEVHDNPDLALCDGASSLHIDEAENLLKNLLRLNNFVKEV